MLHVQRKWLAITMNPGECVVRGSVNLWREHPVIETGSDVIEQRIAVVAVVVVVGAGPMVKRICSRLRVEVCAVVVIAT